MDKKCPTLAAFLLLLLFSGAADGLMKWLGVTGFAIIGAAVMGIA